MVEGPFDDVQEATALFNAKFKEKTGNDWDVDNREDRYVSNAGGRILDARYLSRFVVQLVLFIEHIIPDSTCIDCACFLEESLVIMCSVLAADEKRIIRQIWAADCCLVSSNGRWYRQHC